MVTGNLRIGPFVSLRLSDSSVGSKRTVSSSSRPVLAMADEEKTKSRRLKALMGTKPNYDKPVLKVGTHALLV